MREVFIDTSFLIALVNPSDSLHDAALAAVEANENSMLVVTDEVLVELMNFLSSYGAYLRQAAVQIVETLSRRPDVAIVPQTRESFAQGFVLYAARPDKEYSATDCISMALMKVRKITDVLTNDSHFRQEGFMTLLK